MPQRFRFAYAVAAPPPSAMETAACARLRAAWPSAPGQERSWMTQPHPKGALVVWPRYEGAAARLEEFGEPRPCEDGLLYYPSLVAPDFHDLIRAEAIRPAGEWMDTVKGGSFWCPIGVLAPRDIVIGAKGFRRGAPASELGRLAYEIHDEWKAKDGLAMDDPRTLRVIQLAIQGGYHVTEEMIEDGLPMRFTDRDINPMMAIVQGYDPKPSAVEPAPSPSAQAPTPTSP